MGYREKIRGNLDIIFAVIGSVVAVFLMMNSNNDPVSFGERIFKPIEFSNSGYLQYSGIIVILLFMYSFYVFNERKSVGIFESKTKRFLCALVLTAILPNSLNMPVIIYKSFKSDLNAIYFERNDSYINFNGNEGEFSVNAGINLINCDNEIKRFNIKFRVPNIISKENGVEYITLEKEFMIRPREKARLQINEELKDFKSSYDGYRGEIYEYVLFNDNEEVVFKGDPIHYRLDF